MMLLGLKLGKVQPAKPEPELLYYSSNDQFGIRMEVIKKDSILTLRTTQGKSTVIHSKTSVSLSESTVATVRCLLHDFKRAKRDLCFEFPVYRVLADIIIGKTFSERK